MPLDEDTTDNVAKAYMDTPPAAITPYVSTSIPQRHINLLKFYAKSFTYNKFL